MFILRNIFAVQTKHCKCVAGPIAERSKSSDLDCGREDPGSNSGEGMCFFGMVN